MGLLSFRVRGAYFVIVTISFAEVVRLVALNWVELTHFEVYPLQRDLEGLEYHRLGSSNRFTDLGKIVEM